MFEKLKYNEFVSSLNVYKRVGADQLFVDTRRQRVTELLTAIAKTGESNEVLSLLEDTDLAAMVSGHIRYDKVSATLVAVPRVDGAESILVAIARDSKLYQQIYILLAAASRDSDIRHLLPLAD